MFRNNFGRLILVYLAVVLAVVIWATRPINLNVAESQIVPSETRSYVDWKLFSSEPGDFSVLFPEKPRQRIQMLANTPSGSEIYSYVVEEAGVTYTVSYRDDVQDNFDRVADEWVANLAGNPTRVKAMVMGGYPGLEVEYTLDEQAGPSSSWGIVHLCLANSRLYQISVTGSNDAFSPDAANAFLDSFTLIGLRTLEASAS